MTAIFVLGLGSRYSYLAATQLPGIEGEFGVRFDWWPVNSPDLITAAHGGASPFAAPKRRGQYDPAYRDIDARRWAALYGVPYRPPQEGLEARGMAEACWAFEEPEARRRLAEGFLTAIFAGGRSPGPDLTAEILAQAGSPVRDGAACHGQAVTRALEMGAFGVPSFVLDGEIYWGNDRRALLRAALASRATG